MAPTHVKRFAGRLDKVEESGTALVMIAAQQMKSKGVDVIDLGAGEPDFATPDPVKLAAKRAIDENFTRYTSSIGVPELRDAIVARFRQDFGVTRLRSEVIATVGAKQAIFNILLAMIEPGDEAVIPSPYWVTFPQVVYLCGGHPVIAETDPAEGFRITAELVQRAVTERTRVIILNSPNNPSGAVIPRDEFLKICRFAAEHNIFVLSDECYQGFVYDGVQPCTGVAVPEELRSWVIVAGSLSKNYAMTGWRIGYAIGPQDFISRVALIQGHQTSNPTTISQAAAIEALTGSQESVAIMIREYRRRRDFLIPALNRIPGVRCPMPQGAFYAFPDVRGVLGTRIKSSVDLSHFLLNEAHVVVTPGSYFGVEGFIRLSYAAGLKDLEEAVRRLKELLKKA